MPVSVSTSETRASYAWASTNSGSRGRDVSEGTGGSGSGGIWALVMSVVTLLLKIWDSIPEEQKNKIINTIVESFTKTFEAFFDKFHAWVKSDSADAAPEMTHE